MQLILAFWTCFPPLSAASESSRLLIRSKQSSSKSFTINRFQFRFQSIRTLQRFSESQFSIIHFHSKRSKLKRLYSQSVSLTNLQPIKTHKPIRYWISVLSATFRWTPYTSQQVPKDSSGELNRIRAANPFIRSQIWKWSRRKRVEWKINPTGVEWLTVPPENGYSSPSVLCYQ